MQITILALGSRGDVQPFVPLGIGLQQEGHSVQVATFSEFASLFQDAGIGFIPLQGDARALLTAAMDNQLLKGGSSPIRFIRAIKKSYAALARSLPQDLSHPKIMKSDLILNQLPAYLYGGDLAEYLDIPWAIVSVIPLARTKYSPLISFSKVFSALPGYNALTYRIGEQLGWQLFRSSVNRWRTKQLGMRARPFLGAYGRVYREKVPIINGFSQQVVPRLDDWHDRIYLTGWWYPEDPAWEPPEPLMRFLETGEAPVFIGFGSIPLSDPERITRQIVEAVEMSGVRAILHAGWAGLGGSLPDDIFQLAYAPYGWLFPRMKAVVHHGGSGTSGFGFWSGVPSIIVPFGFDQYFWGERAAALGVGPKPLPFKNLDAPSLAQRIQRATTDPEMARAAELLGRSLKAEDGVSRAVEIIGQLSSE